MRRAEVMSDVRRLLPQEGREGLSHDEREGRLGADAELPARPQEGVHDRRDGSAEQAGRRRQSSQRGRVRQRLGHKQTCEGACRLQVPRESGRPISNKSRISATLRTRRTCTTGSMTSPGRSTLCAPTAMHVVPSAAPADARQTTSACAAEARRRAQAPPAASAGACRS